MTARASIRGKALLAVAVCVVLASLLPRTAHAWGFLAHHEITVAANYRNVAPYASLPDYVESWQVQGPLHGSIIACFDVTPRYCWSHGVQAAGDNLLGFVISIPVDPVRPEDGRWPGKTMWCLAKDKLSGRAESETRVMQLVAKGFRAHNAADSIVHWDYFAASEGLALPGAYQWAIGHSVKEVWADYVVYSGTWPPKEYGRIPFTPEGTLEPHSAFSVGGQVWPDMQGGALTQVIANTMHLAQKVYRKNRRATSALANEGDSEGDPPLDPQSCADIKARLLQKRAEWLSVLADYTRDRWNVVSTVAAANFWSLSTLEDKFYRSVSAVEEAVGGLG